MKNTLVIILGPTAVGKTQLSIFLARKLNTYIISADSRQIYKEMSIGTNVPDELQLSSIKHFFIRNKSIKEYYNASKYEHEVLELLDCLFKEKNILIMVGGSGLYIHAICKGIDTMPDIDMKIREELKKKYKIYGLNYLQQELKRLDPEYYRQVDLKNVQRIIHALEICYQTAKPYSSFRKNIAKKRNFNIIKIGLNIPREQLHEKINIRVDKMIKAGLVDQAKSLYKYRHYYALNTVGYKEIFDYLDGKYNIEKTIELIKRNTRRYARKQISWFLRDKNIHWFSPENKIEILNFIIFVTKNL